MGRPPCCDKSNVKRGLWTPEEDAKILAYVSNHGVGNWTLVPKKAGLNRCGKSCRLRWTNYLRPDLKHDDFTPQEEELIISLHHAIGSRWSLIAKRLPGRTDNDVKNYWNTKLRKKLHKMGIDPVTHKPFSQIISDYGNIGGLSASMSQIGCFTRHLNNNNNSLMFPKIEASSTLNHTNSNMEQAQESSCWELQFQLANFNSVQPHVLNEANSSCSSSPSSSIMNLSSPMSCSSQVQPHTQIQPPLVCSSTWADFLVTEPFPSPYYAPKQEDLYASSSAMQQTKLRAFQGQLKDSSEAASSSMSSFVESILDRDTQMRSEFPQLLDEYDY